jgi:hypothetical protein
MPAVGHAGDAAKPACPGPAPSAVFPCIAAVVYRNAAGGEDGIQPLLAVDTGLRRLVATGRTNVFYQLDIDTPTGVPRQLGPPTAVQGVGTRAMVLDVVRHRVFLGSVSGRVASRSLTGSFPPPGTVTDLAADGDRDPAEALQLAAPNLRALAYDAAHQALYVLANGGASVGVAALDAGAADGTLRFKWWYPTPGCLDTVGDYPFLGVADGGEVLYFGCKGTANPLDQNAPPATPHGVMTVDMGGPAPDSSDGFAAEYHPFAGSLTFGQTAGDPAGERLFVMAGGAGVQRLYVFDARRRAWTGSRPLGGNTNPLGAAADPATGRAYPLQSTTSTLYPIDAAQLPAPQGKPVDLGVSMSGNANQQPAVDPATRRLFLAGVFEGGAGGEGLRVYEDRTAAPLAAPKLDPDAATHDLNESAAVNVKANGEGSAFGARAMAVGGVGGTYPGELFGPTFLLSPAPERQKPNPGNQGLFLADVPLAQLSGDGAGGTARAEARGAGVDEVTEADLRNQAATFEAPGAYDDFKAHIGAFAPSRCADLGNPDDTKTQTGTNSAVSCDAGKTVVASASPSGPMDLSPIKITYTHADVTVARDPVLGVITTSTAVAKGIDIAGGIHIGEIRSTAVSRAHGRKGTAKSTYSTSVNQVRLANPATGETAFACGWATENADDTKGNCNPTAVAQAINQFYGLQIHAEVGLRDKDIYIFNSPGGAQAIVVKDPYLYWSEFNMDNDGGKEVYGLQFTLFDDTLQPSRLVVQLAGVRSEAKYGIGVAKPAIEPDATGSSSAATTDDSLNPLSLSAQDPSSQTAYIQQVSGNAPAALSIQNLTRVLKRIFRQVAQGARFLVRHPTEAGLFGMAWGLMGAPIYLGRRRFLGSLVARAATL